jgi:hypothetical protein
LSTVLVTPEEDPAGVSSGGNLMQRKYKQATSEAPQTRIIQTKKRYKHQPFETNKKSGVTCSKIPAREEGHEPKRYRGKITARHNELSSRPSTTRPLVQVNGL